jgi:soluble lytic murein transglycosylase-like protein
LVGESVASIIKLNKFMNFCFNSVRVGGLLLAAGASLMQAAPPFALTSVVRADPSSGRLVRSLVPVARPAPAPDTKALQLIAARTARHYEVDPLLVDSVIHVESGYNPLAVSPKGAMGLMQLIPSTARRFGVTNPFDPKENIEGGVRYLKYLQGLFRDDRLALAAYNAGEAAVARHGWIPPYPETQNYVYQVGKRYGQARRAAENQPPQPLQPPQEQQPVIEQFLDAEGRLHIRTR